MPIPDTFVDELIERSDIVDVVSQYVQLTKKGGNLFGLCPFHNEKTPSFSVSPDKQIFHCFGCGKGGNVLSFIRAIENLSFPDAVRFLAEKNGMTVPEESGSQELPRQRKRMLELNKEAARWFYACLNSPEGEKAAAYLEKRGISRKTANRFGLGAAPDAWDKLLTAMREKGFTQDELLSAGLVTAGQRKREGGTRSVYDKFRDRLMFPVIDIRGDVLGFSGRSLEAEQEPKYLNSPETLVFSKRRTLFGMNLAKNTKRGSILLVEGNVDVVTLHQAGFDNAVASMGTALTTEQTRLISRYAKEIVICYDNDPAGKKATDRALDLLKNSEFTVRVLRLPDRIVDGQAVKIDADDFIRLRGADAFEQLLSGSGGGMEYRLGELREKYDLTDDMQRLEYLRQVCTLLSEISSPVEREVWCVKAAAGTGVTADALKQETERQRTRNLKSSRKQYEKSISRPARNAQPQEKTLRYENVRSALAEEGVIRLLLLDPSLIRDCPLAEDEFTAPFLGRIYGELRKRQAEGRSIAPAAITAGLEEGESGLLTQILNKPESGGETKDTLNNYVTAIRRERILQSGDLNAITKLMREKQEDNNT